MVIDPISDLIIRLKNASDVRKPSVEVLYSDFAESVAHVLKKAGYISAVEKKENGLLKNLKLGIISVDGDARIHGVERISKPSRRIYQKYSDIRVYKSGFGNAILSTPKGVMTDMDAKKSKVGGEVLFRIW